MGLFSSIGNVINKVAGASEKALDVVGNVVSSTYKATLGKIPVVESVRKFVEANPVAVASGVTGAGALKGIVTSSFAKSLPKTIGSALVSSPKTALASAVLGTAGTSALITNPSKTISAVINAPVSASNFLSNVGSLAVEPSLEKAKETFTENPYIASASILGLGVAGVKTATSIASIIATEKLTTAVEDRQSVLDTSSKVNIPTSKTQTDLGTPETAPLRETQTITSSTKKRRKQAKKPQISNISQRVNLMINNHPVGLKIENKRYLKVDAYAN